MLNEPWKERRTEEEFVRTIVHIASELVPRIHDSIQDDLGLFDAGGFCDFLQQGHFETDLVLLGNLVLLKEGRKGAA